MTLDDLIKIGEDAWNQSYDPMAWDDHEEADKADRARYRAVVAALRDEMDDKGHYEIHLMFNDILGDAGEKAAGGEDSPEDRSPAADPSQCEWRIRNADTVFITACDQSHRRVGLLSEWGDMKNCPSCGKPIKLKAAQGGTDE